MTNSIDAFIDVWFFIFSDFRLNDEISILLHPKTYLKRIIVGLHGDIYHPETNVGRKVFRNLISF